MADFPFGSLVNAGLGLFGISQNNEMIEEQRAMNDWQKAFSRENLEFAKYQYQDSKKYNSAVEQAQRLRAAGLNPAFALGAMSAGQTNSVGGVSSPTLNLPPSADLSALGGLANGIVIGNSQKRLIDSEASKNEALAEGENIDNLSRSLENYERIENMHVDSEHKRSMANLVNSEFEFNLRSMDDKLKSVRLQNDYQDALNSIETINAQWHSERVSREVNEITARIWSLYTSGAIGLKQADAMLWRAQNEENMYNAIYGDSDDAREEYHDEVIDGMIQSREESESREWQNGWRTGSSEMHALGVGGSHHYNVYKGDERQNYQHRKRSRILSRREVRHSKRR